MKMMTSADSFVISDVPKEKYLHDMLLQTDMGPQRAKRPIPGGHSRKAVPKNPYMVCGDLFLDWNF